MKKSKELVQPSFQVLVENVDWSDRLGRLKCIYELILPLEKLFKSVQSSRGEKR